MARKETVGVIGVGRMGNPLANRFIKAKVPLLVHDILPEREAPFQKMKGVRLAGYDEIARECAAIFFVVPSSKEVGACLRGPKGILRNARRGLVIYDLTSSDPAETRKLARAAGRRGVHYLDAGMSGGPAGVAAGTLTLMIGGDGKVLGRTKRFLAPFVKNAFHLGDVGAGHTMKLIHNMVLHTIFLATCEGARLVEQLGMRPKDFIDVCNVSTGYSWASQFRFPKQILSGTWDGAARIYNAHKDVGIAVGFGRKKKGGVELAEVTYAYLRRAAELGMLEEDYTHLYRYFHKVRKVRLGETVKR